MRGELFDGHNMTYWNSIDCDLDKCPLEASFWDYRPSLALNCLLIALFSLSLVVHLGQGIRYKTWGFLISMFFGCVGKFFLLSSPGVSPVSSVVANSLIS